MNHPSWAKLVRHARFPKHRVVVQHLLNAPISVSRRVAYLVWCVANDPHLMQESGVWLCAPYVSLFPRHFYHRSDRVAELV